MKFNKKLSLLLSVGALSISPIFIVASCKIEQPKIDDKEKNSKIEKGNVDKSDSRDNSNSNKNESSKPDKNKNEISNDKQNDDSNILDPNNDKNNASDNSNSKKNENSKPDKNKNEISNDKQNDDSNILDPNNDKNNASDNDSINKESDAKQPDQSKNEKQEEKNNSDIYKETNLLEKFSLNLNQIYDSENKKYYSPEKIFTSTNLYKRSVMELKQFLKEQGSNFDANTSANSEKFLEKIRNIGTYGNYGSTPEEKINYYTEYYKRNLMTEAKYLDRFDAIDENRFIAMTNDNVSKKIEKIIKDNPFGFLPSNLSQFFYYIQLDTIKYLLDFPEKIQDIKANYDDKVGSISLLIITPNNKYKYEFNRENSELKNDNDFYKYIHDRTFSLGFKYLVTKQNPFGGSSEIIQEGSTGTAWVLDRIKNSDAPKGFYEFVIATNIHVLNWADAFDKSKSKHYFRSKEEEDAWFGGFYFDRYWRLETEKKHGKNNKTYDKITNLPANRYKYYFGPLYSKNSAPTNYDFSKNEFLDVDLKDKEGQTNIWRAYLDMILYTPQFDSKSIKTRKDNANLFFKPGYDQRTRIGETPYGGGDIVLTKWRLTASEVEELFPTLFPLLETEKEKDWYIGLGNEDSDSKELESVIQTHFAGGYPVNSSTDNNISFKVTKSTGGTIVTQPRIVDDSEFLDLWVRYDQDKNKKFNPLNEDWKNYEEQFLENVEHGMRLRVLNQLPRMYMKNDFALDSGSSGSMVINSRFNVIGINFLNVQELDDANSKGNALVLFKSSNEYNPEQFSGDIKKDFIKTLKEKKIITVKMNNS
ncbi:hypothetical protein DA803_02640 [[Mycoplasma] phocae]|uniref:DUF31 domain-containing protein n=1 Tax=[Mycoplasma] phocae TaxID=142651 RepID=A0A2Z5IQV0_9BACT|nr:hypothetical protein [[Mycoplasma] phocae]AXE60967.1 hypothetical protein DA803_02640 [[Mycoplasma] phocae]